LLRDLCDVYLAEQPKMLDAIRVAVGQKRFSRPPSSCTHAERLDQCVWRNSSVRRSTKLETMGKNADFQPGRAGTGSPEPGN